MRPVFRVRASTLCVVVALVAAPFGAGLTQVASTATPTAATITVNVDGSQRFQTIDGFGVNALPKSWEGGALRPAIDMLVSAGATVWRVDVGNGHSTWEATNDDGDPFNFNWAAYNAIYSAPAFEDLWSELAYLNTKGVTIELSMSGLVPAWMGDYSVAAGMEDEFVEEVVSLAYYARNTRGIAFQLLSPMNETDLGPPEGISLSDTARFVDLLHRIAVRLDALGMGDVELVGPETSNFNADFTSGLMSDPVVMAHVRRFSYHNYSGCCAAVVSGLIAGSAYPDRHIWLGEWSQSRTDGWLDNGQQVADEWAFARTMTADLLTHLQNGVSAALAWDAWDNWHEHQACCPVSHWGQVYRDGNGIYQPKKRFFSNEQVFRFIKPGMMRIGTSPADPNLRVLAFSDGTNVTLVGQNLSAASLTLSGTLSGTPAVASFAQFRTSASEDFVRGADVAVVGGSFSLDVPADSFFTLTTSSSGPLPSPTSSSIPTASPTPPPTPSPTSPPAGGCTASVGPGIPPPQGFSAGLSGLHAAWYGQSGYPTLCAGQSSTATVAYYNSGSIGWVSGRMGQVAYLGTWGPEPGQDQPSPLGGDAQLGSPNTGWPRYNRVAIQPADYVGPGQIAWFQFTIQAPATPGTYRLYLRPLVEGAAWLEDYGVYWIVTVR